MSKVLLVIAMCAIMFGQTVRMSDKPITAKGVKLTELGTMMDANDGFYEAIDTSVSEDGKVVILDRGNFLVNVFSSDGTLVTQFGKEGQGPGELTNAGRVIAFNDRILLKNFDRLFVFDYTGKLIREIKERTRGASIFKTKHGFKYVFDGTGRANPLLSKEFDLDGKSIAEVADPNYEAKLKQEPRFHRLADRLIIFLFKQNIFYLM